MFGSKKNCGLQVDGYYLAMDDLYDVINIVLHNLAVL